MQKRGQFYLVAALVIIGIIAGLSTVYNYANVTQEDATVYDLSGEINQEFLQVLDYGVLNDLDPSLNCDPNTMDCLHEQIKELSLYYAQSYPNTNFMFIYGSKDAIFNITCGPSDSGDVGYGGTGFGSYETECSDPAQLDVTIKGNKFSISVFGESYEFKLNPGQNFYIALCEVGDGETFCASPSGAEETGTPAEQISLGGFGEQCFSDGTCDSGLHCLNDYLEINECWSCKNSNDCTEKYLEKYNSLVDSGETVGSNWAECITSSNDPSVGYCRIELMIQEINSGG